MSTTTTFPITVVNGVTHTGESAEAMEAALYVCTVRIMSDPEWAAEVIVAAVLAEHELKRGMADKALKTLSFGLSEV